MKNILQMVKSFLKANRLKVWHSSNVPVPGMKSICLIVQLHAVQHSLKQALYVREKYPDALIYIIYKDIRTPAQYGTIL